jgi:hypothetical protein
LYLLKLNLRQERSSRERMDKKPASQPPERTR